MPIIIKNKDTLIYDDFVFRCCVGKNGFTQNKIEGDKKTPRGIFELENVYFRKDRKKIPETKLKNVLLPEPLGPIIPLISFFGSSKSTLLIAFKPPNDLDNCLVFKIMLFFLFQFSF